MPIDFSPTRTGAARMERMPRARQVSRSTRGSSSVSSQRSSVPVLTHSPEKPEPTCKARADGRSVGAGAGAADHEIRIGVGERDGRARGANQGLGALGNQLQSRGKIGAEGFHLPLDGGDRGERVGVVRDEERADCASRRERLQSTSPFATPAITLTKSHSRKRDRESGGRSEKRRPARPEALDQITCPVV